MEQTPAENCPVSGVKVNETVVRLIAFFVVVIATLAGFYQIPILNFFLALDFSLRAFGSGRYSLLKYLALFLSRSLQLKNKPVDAAPKKFAAGLGFVFSLVAGILQVFQFQLAANIVIAILVFCALLEGLLALCIGCIVYGWLQKLSAKK